jgi:hypothetical protein
VGWGLGVDLWWDVKVMITLLCLCTAGSLQELAVAGSCGSEQGMAALLTAACKSRHLHLLDVRGLQLAGKVGRVCQRVCRLPVKPMHCQPALARKSTRPCMLSCVAASCSQFYCMYMGYEVCPSGVDPPNTTPRYPHRCASPARLLMRCVSCWAAAAPL